MQTPTVTPFNLDTDPDTLGMAWRIHWDFGGDSAEYRYGIKSQGT